MGTKGDGNRQRIIEAADQLFYVRGYNQTSFRDISEVTGIPRGNFYYYFKTKDDILDAVVETRVKTFSDMLRQCEEKTHDPRERILCFAEMLTTYEDSVLKVGCPIGSLSAELAKDEGDVQQASRAVFILLREWLSQQFSALKLSDTDNRAMDLLARMQGISLMACTFEDKAFLRRSHNDLKTWINKQTLS